MSNSQPSKVSGQYHSLKGTVVKVSSKEEHAAGEAESGAAQAEAYAEGTIDCVVGKKDAIISAVVGNTTQQIAGNMQHNKGKVQAEANAPA